MRCQGSVVIGEKCGDLLSVQYMIFRAGASGKQELAAEVLPRKVMGIENNSIMNNGWCFNNQFSHTRERRRK